MITVSIGHVVIAKKNHVYVTVHQHKFQGFLNFPAFIINN